MKGLWGFVLVGVVFHLLFIFSIFDIYFRTPLTHGMQPIAPPIKPQAKRLIVILGDGLRADKAFKPGIARHLRFAAGMRGAFGVSHTRVPTESRPGHVALMAGFYEDVSAVAKGWQENPVEFDHLFKKARYSFLMGAPEIMHIFKKKSVSSDDKIWTDSYGAEMVDFGIKDAREQDKWSFDRFERLLEESKGDEELERRLKSDQVVVFLHLLGHDTNGHAYGPQSKEYQENTRYVDERVKQLEAKVEEYFGDQQTAWLFTTDHGMTDGRSHGDGDPQNTMTPLIVWGAGVREPEFLLDDVPNGHDEYSRGWGMAATRVDVQQADICPLMAALLGIPIPVNSEGVLPVSYLNMTSQERLQMSLWNLRQLNENYKIKEEHRKKREGNVFKPFNPSAAQVEAEIQKQPNSQQVGELITKVLQGKRYLQMYDQLFITICAVTGYALWITLCLLKLGNTSEKKEMLVLKGSFVSSLVMAFAWLQRKQAPLQYYGYAFFPLYFGYNVLSLFQWTKHRLDLKTVLDFGLMAVRLPMAFFDRRYIAVEFGAKAVKEAIGRDTSHFKPASSALLAMFGLLRPIKIPSKASALAGAAVAMVFSAVGYVYRVSKSRVLHGQILALAVTMGLVLHTDDSLSQKNGLPAMNQLLGWLSFGASLLFVVGVRVHKREHYLLRLLSLFIPLATLMILLSVSYEVYFFTVLAINLLFWLLDSESTLASRSTQPDKAAVIAREFLIYISGAFFGTGNIASISSFSLPSVYRLITRFDPFLMATLLILKLLLPFFLIGAVAWCKLRREGVDQHRFFLWAMAQAELANLVFFFQVRDEGSWLEIGESISRFVISNCFMVVLLGLIALGKLIVGTETSFDDVKEDERIRSHKAIPLNLFLSQK